LFTTTFNQISLSIKMAPSLEHQEFSPVLDHTERPESPDSVQGGEVKSIEGNASPISTPSLSTPLTETSKTTVPSKKRKHMHESEHDHSESDSEYETCKILKGDPSKRDPTELPIVMTNAAGERKVLWAKMDTGADFNLLAETTILRLGRSSEIQAADEENVVEMGGNKITLDRKITLSFRAGRNNRECVDVEFLIPRQESDTDTDGVSDCVLGWKELNKHHMVTIDIEFTNDAEPGLEILAKSAREECPGGPRKGIFLVTKCPQIRTSGSVRR
jgi:hypothetical protein